MDDHLAVPPKIKPVLGIVQKVVRFGDQAFLVFEILEAIPPVSTENITWYFTGISGRTILSCSNHSERYNFSSNCLTLTISNVTASDGGLYEVFASTRAGNGSGKIILKVSGGYMHFIITWFALSMDIRTIYCCTHAYTYRPFNTCYTDVTITTTTTFIVLYACVTMSCSFTQS